jgi:hypothetical protein
MDRHSADCRLLSPVEKTGVTRVENRFAASLEGTVGFPQTLRQEVPYSTSGRSIMNSIPSSFGFGGAFGFGFWAGR